MPPTRGFRSRWLNREGRLEGLGDEPEAGGLATGVENDVPTGVTVSEQAAKALANHTFLSNVKRSNFSMPWEIGAMKSIFGDDVLGLTTDLRCIVAGSCYSSRSVNNSGRKFSPSTVWT